jgi:hypothetical protein
LRKTSPHRPQNTPAAPPHIESRTSSTPAVAIPGVYRREGRTCDCYRGASMSLRAEELFDLCLLRLASGYL